jgi:uncharacterized membrane protein YhaH (DUF805 family)
MNFLFWVVIGTSLLFLVSLFGLLRTPFDAESSRLLVIVWRVSTLAVIPLWAAFFVKRWRNRRTAKRHFHG